jgi:hypothetical protein
MLGFLFVARWLEIVQDNPLRPDLYRCWMEDSQSKQDHLTVAGIYRRTKVGPGAWVAEKVPTRSHGRQVNVIDLPNVRCDAIGDPQWAKGIDVTGDTPSNE